MKASSVFCSGVDISPGLLLGRLAWKTIHWQLHIHCRRIFGVSIPGDGFLTLPGNQFGLDAFCTWIKHACSPTGSWLCFLPHRLVEAGSICTDPSLALSTNGIWKESWGKSWRTLMKQIRIDEAIRDFKISPHEECMDSPQPPVDRKDWRLNPFFPSLKSEKKTVDAWKSLTMPCILLMSSLTTSTKQIIEESITWFSTLRLLAMQSMLVNCFHWHRRLWPWLTPNPCVSSSFGIEILVRVITIHYSSRLVLHDHYSFTSTVNQTEYILWNIEKNRHITSRHSPRTILVCKPGSPAQGEVRIFGSCT